MNATLCNPMLAWTPGWQELLLVLLIALLLFGGRKLPELARSLGKGIRSFKQEMKGIGDEIDDATSDEPGPHDEQLNSKKEEEEQDRDKQGD